MCKHILNAQVSIRAQCCKKWFDCSECHAEVMDHNLKKTVEMDFICKKCKKAFRKDITDFDEADEYCPQYKIQKYIFFFPPFSCDNHFIINAITKESQEIDKFQKLVQEVKQ